MLSVVLGWNRKWPAQRGWRCSEVVRRTLPTLGEELTALALDEVLVSEAMSDLEQTLREQFADWEMKGSDAEKLMAKFLETWDMISREGVAGLTPHLDRGFADFIEGLAEPDRGTHDNIPWWKLMFLAGAFGWGVAMVMLI